MTVLADGGVGEAGKYRFFFDFETFGLSSFILCLSFFWSPFLFVGCCLIVLLLLVVVVVCCAFGLMMSGSEGGSEGQ